MRLLTLKEAARFLRMSPSTLYQRQDIPRYRRPGSRVMLFDQDELEAWIRQGRMGESIDEGALVPEPQMVQPHAGSRPEVMDIQAGPVYHRNARYR